MVANESMKEILYSCNGPVFGCQICLYQSKIYSKLSIQIFFGIMIKHYSLSAKFIGIWLCDSEFLDVIYNNNNSFLEKVLLDTIEESNKNYYKYPFTLTPELDLLHQVIDNEQFIQLVDTLICLCQDKA